MAIIKNSIPILEYSTERKTVIPPRVDGRYPSLCLFTFFGEVLEQFVRENGAREIDGFYQEMGTFPVYEATVDGQRVALTQATVGGPSAAMQLDSLYHGGVRHMMVCGSCGVLADLPAGHVILPVRALRGEGTSYMYAEPSRFIELQKRPVEAAKKVLSENGIGFTEVTTWTTDGFCRETPEMVEYRKSEGCQTVEMECAGLAAASAYLGLEYGQMLYSGDILADTSRYDDRDFYHDGNARKLLFGMALKTLLRLCKA